MAQASTDERIQNLLSHERSERLDVSRIISLVPLRPYMNIADVGCGPGFFTIPFAKHVWDGTVYAIDVEEAMLETVRNRAAEARLGNIVTVLSEGNEIPPQVQSVDGVFLAFVLHEITDQAGFIKQAHAAVQRSGWCAVVEWRKDYSGEEGPPATRRIGPDEVVEMGETAGLRVRLRRELNDQFYMVVMIK